jgi:histidinol-phosphate aminotransferase
MKEQETPQPSSLIAEVTAYRPAEKPPTIDLHLDGNEGALLPIDFLDVLKQTKTLEQVNRYPHADEFEKQLAKHHGLDAQQVIVTAGGDEAIDRICRAFLEAGREIIIPSPTFEMIARYANLTAAKTVKLPWTEGPYPVDQVLELVGPQTSIIAVVSPNNPSGAVISKEDLIRLSQGAPQVLLMIDLAYLEFADQDLMTAAHRLPNAVCVRSMSKAWGLAGLRVGYATGPAKIIECLRACGHPYPVSRPSLAIAAACLKHGQKHLTEHIVQTKKQRQKLIDLLEMLNCAPLPSQANFVLGEYKDPSWLRDVLASSKIAIRIFAKHPELKNKFRISCHPDDKVFQRLEKALRMALKPQGILFDMDGVLADVSQSYRKAIQATLDSFGIKLSTKEISKAKAEPGSNNDWELCKRLLEKHGIKVKLTDVTMRFEALYQGDIHKKGFHEAETLIPDIQLLKKLKSKYKIGIVTGRPRRDTTRFMKAAGIADLFDAVVCMEDAPLKPNPDPVRLAMQQLKIDRAWMIGDTVDDVSAAIAAGALPLGFVFGGHDHPHPTISDRHDYPSPASGRGIVRDKRDAGGEGREVSGQQEDIDVAELKQSLTSAGCVRVLDNLSQIEEILP